MTLNELQAAILEYTANDTPRHPQGPQVAEVALALGQIITGLQTLTWYGLSAETELRRELERRR